MERQALIPIEDIVESPLPLRTVNRDDVEFIMLRDSIKAYGIIEPIATRLINGKYRLVSGLQRYTAAKDLGHKTIPAYILEIDDRTAIIVELVANASRVKTDPMDYARQMRRIISSSPETTVGFLAGIVNQTPEWVMEQLNLLRLPRDVQDLITQGKMPLSNAYSLSRMPNILLVNHIEDARYLPVKDFQILTAKILREWRQTVSKGYYQPSLEFTPKASLRSIRILREAIDKLDVASKVVVEAGCTTLEQAFNLGVSWAIQLDPASVHQQRLSAERKFNERLRAEARRRAARQKIIEKQIKNLEP